MKNDLTCAVVRDLLPSYVEGLTSDETNTAVESHLSACPDCMARKNAMAAPAEPAETAEQSREVDYLKTVKRKSGRRVVLAIACTLAVILAGVALKLFVIGEPASRDGMSWSMRCDETAMDLRVYSTWSGVAYCRWDLENNDGVVRLTAKKVLPSFLYDSADHRERIPLEGVREVWIANQLIWQDGIPISSGTMDLYGAKTPYVGDMPALNHIAELANIRPNFGDYLNSLHTSSQPYRWTLEFTEDSWQGVVGRDPDTFDKWMARYGIQLLALVENLEEVGWTYTDLHGEKRSGVLTLEEANALLPELTDAYNQTHAGCDWKPLSSVKDYYHGAPADLQRLVEITRISS